MELMIRKLNGKIYIKDINTQKDWLFDDTIKTSRISRLLKAIELELETAKQ